MAFSIKNYKMFTNHSRLVLLILIVLYSPTLLSQSHNIDSLSKVALTEYKNDRVILPFFKRIDAAISFKELDLTRYKVKNKEGTFNLEVKICGHKVLLPKSNDLTTSGPIKLNDLLLDNGNILVADGWIHTLVVGHHEYDNIITTYTMGITTSKLYLKGNRVVDSKPARFDYSDCQ